MRYLTFKEYIEMGGELEEAAFLRNIDRASLMIDRHTQSRLKGFEELPWEVKPLCRDLVEYIACNTVEKPGVSSKSQSIGGVSESENYIVRTAVDYINDIAYMMENYLSEVTTKSGICVLYKGALV